jgi:3D (Asp-Asp-Asp) domain-containing protein
VLQPGPPDPQDVASPAPGLRLRFRATAYCKGTTTASGAGIQTGIAAADPDLLPVGSVIRVESLGQRYNGIYTILDTGPRVKGRQIDIYMWNCNEALAFGRRTISLSVMRLGWNPRTSTPERVGTEFRRREAQIGDGPAASPTSPASTTPPGPPATGPASPPSGTTAPGATAPQSPAAPQRTPGATTAPEPRETVRPSTAS